MTSAKDQLQSVSVTFNVDRHQELGYWWRLFLKHVSLSADNEIKLVKKINLSLWSNHFFQRPPTKCV